MIPSSLILPRATLRTVFLSLLFMLYIGQAQFADAALKNCPDLSSFPGEYKVVLDDFMIGAAAADAAMMSALKQRLQFDLNTQIARLQTSAANVPANQNARLRLVFCADRSPSFNGSEFTPARKISAMTALLYAARPMTRYQ